MTGNGRHPLPRILTGSLAIVLSLVVLATGRTEPVVVLACLYLILICSTDTLTAKIPNLANLGLALAGLSLHLLQSGLAGLLTALLGLLLGLSLLFVPFLLGGVGAGDVKALAALGVLLGPGDVLQLFLYAGLFGGLMALLHYLLDGQLQPRLRAWSDALLVGIAGGDLRVLAPASTAEKLRFPYAAAFAFGFCALRTWGGLL
jgi:prepilin peptidase CpaA